jgi:hypothetical protein
LAVVAGSVLALGALIGAFICLNRKRLIDDLPTSKTRGVFIGFVELKGTAESEQPFTAFLSGERCVCYNYRIDEQWSRLVTETYRDAKGNTHTRTRRETGWNVVARGEESGPFYLKDDNGVIRIVPDGARIENIRTFNETCSPANPLYFGKGPLKEIANSDHRRRFTEHAIPLHTNLYVTGQARERQDMVAPEIARDEDAPLFIISTRTEKQVSTGYGIWVGVWLFLGLVAGMGGMTGRHFLLGFSEPAPFMPFIVGDGIYIVAGFLGWVWTVYNGLVVLGHRVEAGRSQVDIQLKRRCDLIPNLAAMVEGYTSHERSLQTLVASLRAQAADGQLKGLTPELRATVENYPVLKASESFLKLQRELADTEQRIALARDYFNEIAKFYNIRLEIIPDRLVASLMRLRAQPLFTAEEFERAPVQVHLAA